MCSRRRGRSTSAACRATRSVRYAQIFRELIPIPDAPLTLPDQIQLAVSRDEVEALWRAHPDQWTPELTELAKAHLDNLNANIKEQLA